MDSLSHLDHLRTDVVTLLRKDIRSLGLFFGLLLCLLGFLVGLFLAAISALGIFLVFAYIHHLLLTPVFALSLLFVRSLYANIAFGLGFVALG